MTTPTGTIGMSDVNIEIGRSYNTPINLNEAPVRSLAGVSSGAISMNSLRGKSSFVADPVPDALNWSDLSGDANAYGNILTITGINVAITFRLTGTAMNVYNDGSVGASSELNVQALVNGGLVGTLTKGNFGSATGSFDFTVSAGQTVQFIASCSTTGGNGGGSGGGGGSFTITNLSSGSTAIDSFTVNMTAQY